MPWYQDEIARCTYRQFTTGFYFGKPGNEAQIYDANTYVNEYTYLGTVEETDDRGRARITQRNKFSVGDKIEIMKPDGRDIETRVLGINQEDGTAVENAPHPKEILYVQFDQQVEQYDILRIHAPQDGRVAREQQ